MPGCVFFLVSVLAVAAAYPAAPENLKLDEKRYQYAYDGDGNPHLVDHWAKASGLEQMARYDAYSENVYHLFTRTNPNVSQVLVIDNNSTVTNSSFDAAKPVAFIIHGWLNNATSDVNTVLVPAFLSRRDLNVIVVDWSAGANTTNYTEAVANTVTSGVSVASFITWLNNVTSANISSYHIVGHSLGGQQAGIVGRTLGGNVTYITALDPAYPEWENNTNKFSSDVGVYTEVIHTNAGVYGYPTPVGDCDFYPNGGTNMPGCNSTSCDHGRSFYYFGESLISGGFNSTRCTDYTQAMNGTCTLSGNVTMGGIDAKNGESGVFYLVTNAAPPFSQS